MVGRSASAEARSAWRTRRRAAAVPPHRRLHQPDRAGGVQDVEQRQDDAHHDVETLAVGAQHRGCGHARAVGGHGRRVVAAQAQAVEGTLHRDPLGAGGDQPDGAESFGLQGLRRPHVSGCLRCGRDPTLARVQQDFGPVASGGAGGRPEVASRSGFTERQRAQVLTQGRGSPHFLVRVSFQHRCSAIVHAQHHRGGTAILRDTPNDFGCAPETKSESAGFGRTHGAHQTGGSERGPPSRIQFTFQETSPRLRGNCF